MFADVVKDCEDHSVLLCSLLLGFGLDAYVCVGTKSRDASHTWVITISTDGCTTFWESLTGDRWWQNCKHSPDIVLIITSQIPGLQMGILLWCGVTHVRTRDAFLFTRCRYLSYYGWMEGWVDLGYPAMHRPGVKPVTSQSQVRRPNHYTTEPPNHGWSWPMEASSGVRGRVLAWQKAPKGVTDTHTHSPSIIWWLVPNPTNRYRVDNLPVDGYCWMKLVQLADLIQFQTTPRSTCSSSSQLPFVPRHNLFFIWLTGFPRLCP